MRRGSPPRCVAAEQATAGLSASRAGRTRGGSGRAPGGQPGPGNGPWAVAVRSVVARRVPASGEGCLLGASSSTSLACPVAPHRPWLRWVMAGGVAVPATSALVAAGHAGVPTGGGGPGAGTPSCRSAGSWHHSGGGGQARAVECAVSPAVSGPLIRPWPSVTCRADAGPSPGDVRAHECRSTPGCPLAGSAERRGLGHQQPHGHEVGEQCPPGSDTALAVAPAVSPSDESSSSRHRGSPAGPRPWG